MVSRGEAITVLEEVLEEHDVGDSSAIAEDILDRLQAEFPDDFYEEEDAEEE